MNAPILEINHLGKSFGPVEVLKDISLSMEKGEFLVLLGPSGCGKSTLLNCIAGLEEVTSGELNIGGKTMNEVPPRDRDIAMVFQSYALYPNMTVEDNINFGMKVRGEDVAERNRKTAEVAKLLKIEPLLDRKPAQLSGGQRQRVAMGRALVRNPQLFLFDEPLSNLDAKLRVEMRAEIRRLHQTLGASIVYVTHDQIEALTLATHIAVLKDGIIQQVGTPTEIYNSPSNIFVADFMGSPPMNLIPATATGTANGVAVRIDRPNNDPLELTDKRINAEIPEGVKIEVLFGIRPENLTSSLATKNPVQTAEMIIELVEPAGSDKFVEVTLGGEQVTARLPADFEVEAGQTHEFAFAMAKASYFSRDTGIRLG